MENTTNRVFADNYLNIQFGIDNWQLVSTELEQPTVLVRATTDSLITHPLFAEVRELPNATLSPAQVARVILGWAPEDNSWRLGMLLIEGDASKVDTLQMQWCELASWSDGGTSDAVLKQTAQSLARLINRPFQLVEPDSVSRVPVFSRTTATPETPEISLSPQQESYPQSHISHHEDAGEADFSTSYPTIPLDPLPIQAGGWRLMLAGEGIFWERQRRWIYGQLIRMLFFAVVAGFFVIVGIGVQSSGIAAVDPPELVYAAYFVALFVARLFVVTLLKVIRLQHVHINTHQRQVMSQSALLSLVSWRVDFESIDYILVSQSLTRPQGRANREDPMNTAQDVWLHIASKGDFHKIVHLPDIEGKCHVWDIVRRHKHRQIRRQLHLAEYDTPAHHAAFHIAERIGVPVYIDILPETSA